MTEKTKQVRKKEKEKEEPKIETHHSGDDLTNNSTLSSESTIERTLMMFAGQRTNHGLPGLTPEHIDKIIDGGNARDIASSKERREARWMYVIVFILVLVFIVSMLLIFKDNPTALKEIVIPIITLVLGFAGGFGLGRSTKKEE